MKVKFKFCQLHDNMYLYYLEKHLKAANCRFYDLEMKDSITRMELNWIAVHQNIDYFDRMDKNDSSRDKEIQFYSLPFGQAIAMMY